LRAKERTEFAAVGADAILRLDPSIALTSKRAAINQYDPCFPLAGVPVVAAFYGGFHIMKPSTAKFGIGQVVKHRKFPFRGIIYDVDPVFANTEAWWQAIPEEVRPRKDQPYYHLFAENAETEYVAYVSEQNLIADPSGDPLRHPQADEMFVRARDGAYKIKTARLN
jgi:heat shock protein HspQ